MMTTDSEVGLGIAMSARARKSKTSPPAKWQEAGKSRRNVKRTELRSVLTVSGPRKRREIQLRRSRILPVSNRTLGRSTDRSLYVLGRVVGTFLKPRKKPKCIETGIGFMGKLSLLWFSFDREIHDLGMANIQKPSSPSSLQNPKHELGILLFDAHQVQHEGYNFSWLGLNGYSANNIVTLTCISIVEKNPPSPILSSLLKAPQFLILRFPKGVPCSFTTSDHINNSSAAPIPKHYPNLPIFKLFDVSRPKCSQSDTTRELDVYQIELNELRQLAVEVSCLDKNLDYRLLLSCKRTLTYLTDEENHNLSRSVKSGVIGPEVKGGMRWPLGMEILDDMGTCQCAPALDTVRISCTWCRPHRGESSELNCLWLMKLSGWLGTISLAGRVLLSEF